MVTCTHGDSALGTVCGLLTLPFTEQQMLLFSDAGTLAFERSQINALPEPVLEVLQDFISAKDGCMEGMVAWGP